MFAQIKNVIDILSSGFKSIREFKSASDREKAIVDMLRFYFLLKDCVDDGELIIAEAGRNPVAMISSLSPDTATQVLARWDLTLRRQAVRLNTLEDLLFSQDALAVINPALQTKLRQAIGYKMQRAVTLHGIGSALVIRCIFPLSESPTEIAQLVLAMAGKHSRGKINQARIRREVSELRSSLDDYRDHINQLATKAEILKLSKKARKAAQLPKGA